MKADDARQDEWGVSGPVRMEGKEEPEWWGIASRGSIHITAAAPLRHEAEYIVEVLNTKADLTVEYVPPQGDEIFSERTIIRCRGRTWELGAWIDELTVSTLNPGELVGALFFFLMHEDGLHAERLYDAHPEFEQFEITPKPTKE